MDGGEAVVAAVLGAVVFCMPLIASAEMTGNDLQQKCQNSELFVTPGASLSMEGSVDALACFRYVAAIWEGTHFEAAGTCHTALRPEPSCQRNKSLKS